MSQQGPSDQQQTSNDNSNTAANQQVEGSTPPVEDTPSNVPNEEAIRAFVNDPQVGNEGKPSEDAGGAGDSDGTDDKVQGETDQNDVQDEQPDILNVNGSQPDNLAVAGEVAQQIDSDQPLSVGQQEDQTVDNMDLESPELTTDQTALDTSEDNSADNNEANEASQQNNGSN